MRFVLCDVTAGFLISTIRQRRSQRMSRASAVSLASSFPFSCCSQLSGCATAGLGNRAICVAPWPLGPIRAKLGLLSRPKGRGARGCAPKILLGRDLGFLREAKQQALKIPILTTAGATQRPSRPQCCRPRTTCNSRRRCRQAAAANSSSCATKACASPTPPSRSLSCLPTSAPGSRRAAPARRSRLLSR